MVVCGCCLFFPFGRGDRRWTGSRVEVDDADDGGAPMMMVYGNGTTNTTCLVTARFMS